VNIPWFDTDPGPKRFHAGTHRLVDPRETLNRVKPLMPAMGITRLGNITGLDRIGIPVAIAVRPNSRSLAVAQGKGASLDAAKASALMEAIETYHAENIVHPLRYGSYADLRDVCHLVETDALPCLPNSLFNPHLPMLWMDAVDLMRRETVVVPYELASLNFTLPMPPGSGCFLANSNGLASGNHLLEAVSHAISEVVERDALGLFELRSPEECDQRRLRFDTIDDEVCSLVLKQFQTAGISIGLWDMTSDIGMAAFLCIISDPSNAAGTHAEYRASGAGCHPSRSIALLRAMTEAAQLRLAYISGSRDDLFRNVHAKFREPGRVTRPSARLQLGSGLKDFRSVSHVNAETFQAEVAWQLERLRTVGISRVIAVDLTKSEFGIPVVKVIIPGLEGYPYGPNYVPGPRAEQMGSSNA
jgi:YcaO-like protein with predicted kinase domain